MEMGLFIPIGNNGWLISTTSPQYKPTFDLNRQIVQRAEHYGLDFALSMIKLRGFGGKSEFWDYNLESFTLMAGLAAVTSKIKLYASVAVLTLPPAVVARMAVTIDSIAPGRFGVNIVSGWHRPEYEQMGLWPGDDFFGYRYAYSSEYVHIMRELWETGVSNFKGEHFQMDDCRLLPKPSGDIKIVCAGQSDVGMAFTAKYGDYNFASGVGLNTPKACAPTVERLAAASHQTGRDVGTYVLVMVIADETDEAAMAKWQHYKAGADIDALSWMMGAAHDDKKSVATGASTAAQLALPEQAVNLNIGTIVGSYASVARMLDEIAAIPGTKGIMMCLDDFLVGVEQFGQRIQPLMASRNTIARAVA
jgi:pyrimidine oxygenase